MRGLGVAALLALSSGFVWPCAETRLVKELTSASSPRDKRDGLRRLRALHVAGAPESPDERALVETLRGDPDAEVRLDALMLLAALRHDTAAWLVALEDEAGPVRAAAVQALEASPDLAPILRAADDSDARVRLASVRVLSNRQADLRALDALQHALRDGSVEVRVTAAHALASRREPAARTALLIASDDAVPELRAAAVEALSRRPDPESLAVLTLALDDADEGVVLSALRALAASSPDPLPAQVAVLAKSTASPRVASAASRLLSRARARLEPPTPARDPLWLAPLERTADRTLSAEESERLLLELEQRLPSAEPLATDPLLQWLEHAPAALRRRIALLTMRTAGSLPPDTLAKLRCLLTEGCAR